MTLHFDCNNTSDLMFLRLRRLLRVSFEEQWIIQRGGYANLKLPYMLGKSWEFGAWSSPESPETIIEALVAWACVKEPELVLLPIDSTNVAVLASDGTHFRRHFELRLRLREGGVETRFQSAPGV
jgi:hypothetical protein